MFKYNITGVIWKAAINQLETSNLWLLWPNHHAVPFLSSLRNGPKVVPMQVDRVGKKRFGFLQLVEWYCSYQNPAHSTVVREVGYVAKFESRKERIAI